MLFRSLHANEERIKSRVPNQLRAPVFGFLGKHYPNYRWMPQVVRGRSTFRALSKNLVDAYTDSMTILNHEERLSMVRNSYRLRAGDASAQTLFANYAQSFSGCEPLDLMQHIDFHTWLPGDINTKVDRASMAHSLEAREPLLDHKLIEFAATIPQQVKLSVSEGKIPLKQITAKQVPRSTVYRAKQGFSVPVDEWMRGPLAIKLKANLQASQVSDVLNTSAILNILESHTNGHQNRDRALWTVFALTEFLVRQ